MSAVRLKSQNRLFPRFVPASSVSAVILDEDLDVVRGVVSNVSETGVALVTNRSVSSGVDIDLRLSEKNKGIFEARARVIWSSQGASTAGDVVGNLVGLSFVDQSPRQQEAVRRFFWSTQTSASNGGSKKHFDELVDPHLEQLFTGASEPPPARGSILTARELRPSPPESWEVVEPLRARAGAR